MNLSSNVPHLQLRWLQNMSSCCAPELFVNNITIKGIASNDDSDDENNNQGTENLKQNLKKCNFKKVIDFNGDG